MAQVRCEVELQVADARTGRSVRATRCPRAAVRPKTSFASVEDAPTAHAQRWMQVIRRRGGLEVVSEDPPLRSALKMKARAFEVYSSHVRLGKLTFIRREATRVYQFNLREGDPQQMQALLAFAVREGAQSKTRSPRSQPHELVQVVAASLAARRRLMHPYGLSPSPRKAPASPRVAAEATKRPRDVLSDRSMDSESLREKETRRKVRRVLLSRTSVKAEAVAKSESETETETRMRKPREALTADQRHVLSLVARKRNVFFTGSAGSGKSFLLQHMLRHVALGRVYVTAPTGVAAYNVGGVTLHHFAGMTTRPYASRRELLADIQRKADAVARWRSAQALVIDEVSMLDGKLFGDLDYVARALRRNQAAFFGGIQLVLSGDFCQLPPVARQHSHATLCFESDAWKEGVHEVVVLRDVFRQQNAEFVDILNAFRMGNPTRAMVERINACCRSPGGGDWDEDEDEDAIRIFTHNDAVLQTNTKRLIDLPGKKFNFIASDRGRAEYLSGCPAPPVLSLKKNAKVMLTKTINATAGLVNGCRGVVEGFTSHTNLPIVRFTSGATEVVRHEEFTVRVADAALAARRQLPLTLAWAISIHKSQGLAFDAAVLDLARVFEFGQAYVALSRVRSLDGLYLRRPLPVSGTGVGSTAAVVLADPRVLAFYQSIAA